MRSWSRPMSASPSCPAVGRGRSRSRFAWPSRRITPNDASAATAIRGRFHVRIVSSDLARGGRANSLRTGNLTGNFSGFGPSERFSRPIDQINQRLAPQFPEPERTGNFFAGTGNFSDGTGNYPFPERSRAIAVIPGRRKVRLAPILRRGRYPYRLL